MQKLKSNNPIFSTHIKNVPNDKYLVLKQYNSASYKISKVVLSYKELEEILKICQN